MSTEYPYTKAGVSSPKLALEIEADATITKTLENIDWNSPDSLSVWFDLALTGGEETALDTIVTNHDGNPPTTRSCYCYDCGCPQSKPSLAALTECPVCLGTDIQAAYHNDNLDATTNPTVNDDGTQGYCEGSFWMNLTFQKIFWCLDNTTGAAVWRQDPILETDGGLKLFNQLRIYDTTGAEYAILSRSLTYATLDGGVGANLKMRTNNSDYIVLSGTNILFYKNLLVGTDSTYNLAADATRLADGFINDVHFTGLHPTEIAQAEEPNLAAGEMKIWRDTDTDDVYIVYNNPTAGQGKIQFA